MKDCIGGVILYDETIKQTTSFGKSIPDLILSSGALPGLKLTLVQNLWQPPLKKKLQKLRWT